MVQLKDHPLTQPDAGLDTTAYVTLAQRVLDGDWGLGPGLYFVSPLYIYFLAACLALLKSYTAVRVVQIALGTASVGFIWSMTRAWFGERAAWIAAALAALTGLFTFYEILILQSSIDGFLTSAGLYLLTVAHPLAAGIVFGIQTLNRPNVLIATAGMAIVMALVQRRVKPSVLLAAGLAIGMSPALIRNIVVARQFSFVSSHGGLNFYIGNAPEATGFYRLVPGITPTIEGQQVDVRRVAERALGHPVTDAEASDYFYRLSRDWFAAHPAAALILFLKKFFFVFNAQHTALPHSYPFYAHDAATALRFYAIGPWLLFPLGLTGLIFCRPDRSSSYLVWASFVPLYAAAVAAFFVAERYRLPLFVPLCAGAGALVDRAILAWQAARLRTFAAPAAVAAAAVVLVNWPLHVDDGRWQEGLRLAQRLVILGRDDEADSWAERIAVREPNPGATADGVAEQYLLLGKNDRALRLLARAHDANPGNPRIDYDFGRALFRSGRASEAIAHLARGFEAGVELPNGGFDYAAALHQTGNDAGAAAAIRRIHPAEGEPADAWLRLGRLAAEAHAPDVAEPFFRHAVGMQPDSAAARQQLGLDLLVLNRCGDAANELARAAQLDARDPDTLSHLAYCELRLGRLDDARAHAAAALAIDPADALARQIVAVR